MPKNSKFQKREGQPSSSPQLQPSPSSPQLRLPCNNQVLHKSAKVQQKIITANGKTSSNMEMRVLSNGIVNNRKDKSTDTTSGTINTTIVKITNCITENIRRDHEQKLKKSNINVSAHNASNYASRFVPTSMNSSSIHEHSSKSKRYVSKMKNDPSIENKDSIGSHYVCRTSGNNIDASPFPLRFTNHSVLELSHRENRHPNLTVQQTRQSSRNDAVTFNVARKSLEQGNIVRKIPPMNFPPLRAPQSIVDVRHPFVTEARTKHSDTPLTNIKSKQDSLQSGIKELYTGQSYHSYGTSSIAGLPSIQNLGNVNANISSYLRTDSYGQATVANVLFSETARFPQSPPFNAPQVGQINQYTTYDPSNYSATSVNPVMTQYSTDNTIAYRQYENTPQFVQTNHYPTSDITNSRYRYHQAAGVGQIQESPLFIQSLQSPIAVTDRYAATNYARAIRTDLVPRLHRPSRFNK